MNELRRDRNHSKEQKEADAKHAAKVAEVQAEAYAKADAKAMNPRVKALKVDADEEAYVPPRAKGTVDSSQEARVTRASMKKGTDSGSPGVAPS